MRRHRLDKYFKEKLRGRKNVGCNKYGAEAPSTRVANCSIIHVCNELVPHELNKLGYRSNYEIPS